MTDYIYFNSYKVDSKYRDSVKETITDFQKKIKRNRNFLNNFTFHICGSYGDLNKNSNLTKYVSENSKDFEFTGGMTTPRIGNNGKKEIILRTTNISIFGIKSNKALSDISQATMHELGHQFDDYFGNLDPLLKKEVEKLPLGTDDEGTEAQQKLYNKYLHEKDLSDSKEFKTAWKKDAQNLGKSNLSNYLFKHRHLDYYVWDVNIEDGVTDEEVEEADESRSEIFAQLFSYALGQDDGQKDAITEKYPNCYKQVKSYIEQHFGIKAN